eukprot:Rmarinus@m.2508
MKQWTTSRPGHQRRRRSCGRKSKQMTQFSCRCRTREWETGPKQTLYMRWILTSQRRCSSFAKISNQTLQGPLCIRTPKRRSSRKTACFCSSCQHRCPCTLLLKKASRTRRVANRTSPCWGCRENRSRANSGRCLQGAWES